MKLAYLTKLKIMLLSFHCPSAMIRLLSVKREEYQVTGFKLYSYFFFLSSEGKDGNKKFPYTS